MKKILISITFFICVVLLISILVFLEVKRQEKIAQDVQQEQKQESFIQDNDQQEAGLYDWKTYESEEYGLRLSYPQDWTINDENTNRVILVSPETQQKAKDSEMKGRYFHHQDVTISYYDSLADLKDEASPVETLEEYINSDPLYSNPNLIEIANNRAWEVTEGGYASSYTILTEHEDHIYEVQFGRWDKSHLTEEDEKIISTFKFLEKDDSSDVETKGWKSSEMSYENKKIKFSYPSSCTLETASETYEEDPSMFSLECLEPDLVSIEGFIYIDLSEEYLEKQLDKGKIREFNLETGEKVFDIHDYSKLKSYITKQPSGITIEVYGPAIDVSALGIEYYKNYHNFIKSFSISD